jgi:hypothetical protein
MKTKPKTDERGFRFWVRTLGLAPSNAVRRAAAYLEGRGQRFLVHFGVDNAVPKAREDWLSRRRKRS